MLEKTGLMEIHPEDIGTKIQFLDGYRGAQNRELRNLKTDSVVQRLKRSWNSVTSHGVITLLVCQDGVYRILDGQHRMKLLVDWWKQPCTFPILYIDEATEIEDDQHVARMVNELNDRIQYRPCDEIANYQEFTKLITPFKAQGYDWEPSFLPFVEKITWANIAQGISNAKIWEKKGDIRGLRWGRTDIVFCWLSASSKDGLIMAKALGWWRPAFLRVKGVGGTRTKKDTTASLRSSVCMAIAFLLQKKYGDDPAYASRLEKAADLLDANLRVSAFPSTHSSGACWQVVAEVLRCLNFGARKNVLNLFGITGR